MNDMAAREKISALADGELSEDQLDKVFSAMRVEGQEEWRLYHLIGDALRSNDTVELHPDFNKRLNARLQTEPMIAAPGCFPERVAQRRARWALSGMAVAGVAALAFVATPSLMVAIKGDSARLTSASGSPDVASAITVAVQESDALRDPSIDEYLLAHQRFSPSLYSTTQYARSAAFAIEPGK